MVNQRDRVAVTHRCVFPKRWVDIVSWEIRIVSRVRGKRDSRSRDAMEKAELGLSMDFSRCVYSDHEAGLIKRSINESLTGGARGPPKPLSFIARC